MGDFLVTLPVLAALRRQFPETRLELVAYPAVAALALESGSVDAVQPIEARPLAGFFARVGILDDRWSEYFAGMHVIFTYLFDPDELFRNNLARVTRAQVIQGPHRPQEPHALHATDQLLEPLQKLAIFDADPVPRLRWTDSGIGLSPFPSMRPWLAVHPGSGGRKKNWAVDRWLELLRGLLIRFPVQLLLVGGEADREEIRALASALPSDRFDVALSRPLPELARWLTKCVGFLGHDSGISHLAAAVGIPGRVLWGPTESVVWRPRSDVVHLIRAPDGDLAQLTVSAVASEVDAAVADWLKAGEQPRRPPDAA